MCSCYLSIFVLQYYYVKKFFKKYFVPHEGNDYKPHLFRETGALIIFSVAILLFIVSVSGHIVLIRTNLTALVLPNVLVDYANQDRQDTNGNNYIGNLAISPILEKAAQLKANDMANKGYFAHNSPEGHTPWYFFEIVGYNFSFAGENLAVNFADSVDVNQAWMNSPGHRQNIMNGNFSEIGIAIAQGIYQGKETIFVVELFGRPSEPEPTVLSKPTATTVSKTKTTIAKTVGTTTSIVLSETVSSQILAQNGTNGLFIAVEKKSSTSSAVSNTKYSTIFQKMLMSPKKSLNSAYLILLIIIIVGLVLTVFVEMKKQHPRQISLALGLLVVILGLLYIYQSMLFTPLLII